jgi:hypothetical protein
MSEETIMFRKQIYILILWLMAMPAFAGYGSNNNSGNKQSESLEVLRFNTMYAVDGPFVSHVPTQLTDLTIRDVLGDSLPWKIRKSIQGVLFANGVLKIQVRGLVFPGRPNDEENFRALVSCQTLENNVIVVKNLITAPFRTGGRHNNPNLIRKGNVDIKARLTLPRPCVAPIVMILNGDAKAGNLWFAVTGL